MDVLKKQWFIVISCILFFPLGFYLIRKQNSNLSKKKNILLFSGLTLWFLLLLFFAFARTPRLKDISITTTMTELDTQNSAEFSFVISPERAKIKPDEILFTADNTDLVVIKDISDYNSQDYRFLVETSEIEGPCSITISYRDISSNSLEIEVVDFTKRDAVNNIIQKIDALVSNGIETENNVKEVCKLYNALPADWKKVL